MSDVLIGAIEENDPIARDNAQEPPLIPDQVMWTLREFYYTVGSFGFGLGRIFQCDGETDVDLARYAASVPNTVIVSADSDPFLFVGSRFIPFGSLALNGVPVPPEPVNRFPFIENKAEPEASKGLSGVLFTNELVAKLLDTSSSTFAEFSYLASNDYSRAHIARLHRALKLNASGAPDVALIHIANYLRTAATAAARTKQRGGTSKPAEVIPFANFDRRILRDNNLLHAWRTTQKMCCPERWSGGFDFPFLPVPLVVGEQPGLLYDRRVPRGFDLVRPLQAVAARLKWSLRNTQHDPRDSKPKHALAAVGSDSKGGHSGSDSENDCTSGADSKSALPPTAASIVPPNATKTEWTVINRMSGADEKFVAADESPAIELPHEFLLRTAAASANASDLKFSAETIDRAIWTTFGATVHPFPRIVTNPATADIKRIHTPPVTSGSSNSAAANSKQIGLLSLGSKQSETTAPPVKPIANISEFTPSLQTTIYALRYLIGAERALHFPLRSHYVQALLAVAVLLQFQFEAAPLWICLSGRSHDAKDDADGDGSGDNSASDSADQFTTAVTLSVAAHYLSVLCAFRELSLAFGRHKSELVSASAERISDPADSKVDAKDMKKKIDRKFKPKKLSSKVAGTHPSTREREVLPNQPLLMSPAAYELANGWAFPSLHRLFDARIFERLCIAASAFHAKNRTTDFVTQSRETWACLLELVSSGQLRSFSMDELSRAAVLPNDKANLHPSWPLRVGNSVDLKMKLWLNRNEALFQSAILHVLGAVINPADAMLISPPTTATSAVPPVSPAGSDSAVDEKSDSAGAVALSSPPLLSSKNYDLKELDRLKNQPTFDDPKGGKRLPINTYAAELVQAMFSTTNPMTVVQAHTGSGKTTQVPHMIVEEWYSARTLRKKAAAAAPAQSMPANLLSPLSFQRWTKDSVRPPVVIVTQFHDQHARTPCETYRHQSAKPVVVLCRLAREARPPDTPQGHWLRNLIDDHRSSHTETAQMVDPFRPLPDLDELSASTTRDALHVPVIIYCRVEWLLLVLAASNSFLDEITHLVLDEVHQRSVEADLLYSVVRHKLTSSNAHLSPQVELKRAMTTDSKQFSDADRNWIGCRLVVMSASFDATRFSSYFCADVTAPPHPIQIDLFHHSVETVHLNRMRRWIGRHFSVRPIAIVQNSVDVLLRKLRDNSYYETVAEEKETFELIVHLTRYLRQHNSFKPILVFVSNEDVVTEVIDRLTAAGISGSFEKFQALSDDQLRAAKDVTIVGTYAAETSVTIPQLCGVIDTGLDRRVRFNPFLQTDEKVISWISRASAKQRAGRTGRTCPGLCFRLYTSIQCDEFAAYDDAEVKIVSLPRVLLKLKGLARPELPLTALSPARTSVESKRADLSGAKLEPVSSLRPQRMLRPGRQKPKTIETEATITGTSLILRTGAPAVDSLTWNDFPAIFVDGVNNSPEAGSSAEPIRTSSMDELLLRLANALTPPPLYSTAESFDRLVQLGALRVPPADVPVVSSVLSASASTSPVVVSMIHSQITPLGRFMSRASYSVEYTRLIATGALLGGEYFLVSVLVTAYANFNPSSVFARRRANAAIPPSELAARKARFVNDYPPFIVATATATAAPEHVPSDLLLGVSLFRFMMSRLLPGVESRAADGRYGIGYHAINRLFDSIGKLTSDFRRTEAAALQASNYSLTPILDDLKRFAELKIDQKSPVLDASSVHAVTARLLRLLDAVEPAVVHAMLFIGLSANATAITLSTSDAAKRPSGSIVMIDTLAQRTTASNSKKKKPRVFDLLSPDGKTRFWL